MSDSQLVESLRTTYQTNAWVTSQQQVDSVITQASSYFIHKNLYRKWGIVCVDIPTTAALLYNEGHHYVEKQLGLLTSVSLEGHNFDDTLWIIECDKFTPTYIFDMAKAHTAGGLCGQILNICHAER